MNYREFTERVYNYKHGLTNSAESQTNESIEHSAKGDEWNQHKYKEKIYLGNGTFRYVYDDGTESTGTKPLDYDDPGRQSQRAKPLVDNFNGRQATKEQAQGISSFLKENTTGGKTAAQENNATTQSPSDPSFSQARKEAYSSESSKPIPYAQQDKEIASGKAEELKRKAAGSISPTYRTGEDLPWQQVQGTKEETKRKLASNIDKEPITTPALEKSIADTAVRNQAATASGIAAERVAAGTPSGETPAGLSRAMTETAIRNNGAPQSTPYNDLQAQSVTATQGLNRIAESNAKNEAAKSALDGYTNQLRDVYYDLNNAGLSDDEIMNLIRTAEKMKMGESIIDQINGYDPKKQNMVFMAGAEEAFNGYADKVIPVLKAFTSSYEQTGSANLNSANAVANPDPNAKPEPVDLSKYDSDVKAFGETYGQTAADVMQAYKNGGIDAAVNTYLDSDWAQGFKEAARTIANERGLSDDEIFDINTYKNFYGNAIPDDWFSKIYYPASAARQYMSGDEYDKFADQIEKILRTIVNNQGVNDYYKNK